MHRKNKMGVLRNVQFLRKWQNWQNWHFYKKRWFSFEKKIKIKIKKYKRNENNMKKFKKLVSIISKKKIIKK